MPRQERHKTDYKGVFFVEVQPLERKAKAPLKGTKKKKPKKKPQMFYIRFRRDGRLVEEKVGLDTHGMTPAKASHLRADRIRGASPTNEERREQDRTDKDRWTFNRIWEAYIEATSLKGFDADQSRYKNYLRSRFGEKEPIELLPLDVDRIRVNLSKKKAPQTVKHVLALLRRLLNFAKKKRLCEVPDFEITLPTVDNCKTEDLTPAQLRRLLKTLDEYENVQVADLAKLALFTGLRRGSLMRLEWKDISFKQGFITVREPKGGRDYKIPLNDRARNILKNHPRVGDSPYIFPGRDGGPRKNVTRAMREIKKKARLPKSFRHLHGLRHVFSSMLASSGKVDMYTLQKLLGHKTPQMTMRYSHLRDEALKQASELAGALVDEQLEEAEKDSGKRTG